MREKIGYSDAWSQSVSVGRRFLSGELTVANAFSVAKPLFVFAANKSGVESDLYKPLIAASFVADICDGMAARRFGSSPQGGVVDVLTDHASEGLLYKHLSEEEIIPKWVPVVTLVRNVATDVIREAHVVADSSEGGQSVLHLNESQVAKKLVGSRVMRLAYGLLKSSVALTADKDSDIARNLSKVAVGVSIVRGIPVVLNKRNYQLFKQN